MLSARLLCLLALPLSPLCAGAQLVGLPDPPKLTPQGYGLIVEFETGGRAQYNRWPHPEWPGFASGVTWGIGYDGGYNTRPVILRDWRDCPEVERLASVSGITGAAAKPRARELRDILVTWDLASAVFNEVTVTRFWQLTRRTYPGFDDLRPNAQAALISLTFNRGSSMAGPRRTEMRAVQSLVKKQDYAGIAAQLRAMIRVWRGTDIEEGMRRRREAEARLVETP